MFRIYVTNTCTEQVNLSLKSVGIKYADEITECKYATKEIAKAADIPESYGTEISKGTKLAKYVTLK